MIEISSCHLKHADHWQILIQSLLDLGIKDTGRTLAISFLRFLIHFLLEDLGYGIPVMPGELGYLDNYSSLFVSSNKSLLVP